MSALGGGKAAFVPVGRAATAALLRIIRIG